MKQVIVTLSLLCAVLFVAGASVVLAEGADKAAKKRAKIDARSNEVLEQVLGESPRANELYQKAMGYAVFDNTKAALMISGGGGSGVAAAKTTFHDGMAVFVRTKKGLMASADVSGTKYWKSDLND